MKLGLINSAWAQAGKGTAFGIDQTKRIGFDTIDIFADPLDLGIQERRLIADECAKVNLPIVSVACVAVGLIDFNPSVQRFHLDRCRRYYRKSFQLATAPAQNVGSNIGAAFAMSHVAAAAFAAKVEFDNNMRAAPTVTTYNPAAANANWRDVTNGADRTVTVGDQSDSGFTLTGTAGAAAALNYIHWQASAEL